MSDNFRVAECLATPSQQFCIYDYTKIAYLIGNYLCIREVVTPDSKPTFIELENYNFSQGHSQKYIGITSYPNCLVLAERAPTRDIILHFYNQDQQHIKIPSELGRKAEHESQLKIEMYHSQNYIYLVVKRQCDVEILVVNYAFRCFAGRGFVSGDVGEFKIKAVDQLELFSIFMKDTQQVIQYEVCSIKNQEHAIKIIQKNHWEMRWKDLIHCWAKEELVVAVNDFIHIFIESKEVQTIQGFRNIHLLTTTASGFMVSNNSHLRIYKKNSSVFDFKTQYSLHHHPNSPIDLSPQQDMLAFYEEKTKSICYSINYDSQDEQKQKGIQELPLMKIEHHIQNQIKTYSSAQSLMVVTSGSIINIISPISFQCYLSMRANIREVPKLNESKKMFRSTSLFNQKLLSQMGEGQPIQTVGIHPVQPIIGVAFRSLVRVYSVLYNEFKIIKEIQMSHCKQIGFNNSGSIMHAKVGGKQGNKIYLYNSLQNFECLEILSASRPIEWMKWSHLDHTVYGFHQHGYYSWSIDSFFKQRNQSTVQINFPVKGAEIYYNSVIIWGQKSILQIQNNAIIENIKTQKILSNLIVQNNSLLFTSQGEMYRCKGLNNINTTLNNSGFKVPQGIKLFTVKNNVLLYLTTEGNIFCYEWGPEEKNHLEIVSIERKKIDKYQNEYKRYEETISDLEQQLVNQIELIREQFSRRQHQQRQHFLNELKDREDRYLSIRGEKVKIEQTMEENMTAHQQETMLHVKELQRIYERKIAITTNKLLTSEQIGFRNQLLAKQNLHFLQQKHSEDIYEVRNEYSKTLEKQLKERDVRDELYAVKKEYETKLSELQQENQNLLKRFQNQTENNIINLKKNVVNLELKYSEAISQKYNLTKQFEQERIQLDVLRSKNQYLNERLQEEIRRGEQLTRQYARIQALIVQKEGVIVCLEKRIQDLEKSNEIFKYRIIQMKNLNDPKEEEILKLKDNMIELEQQYEKIVKKAMQYEQVIALLKKDVNQLKQSLAASQLKQRKIDKNYGTVMDKLRQATKAPIQEIRRMLIRILDDFDNPGELRAQQEQKRSNSPLGELNRVREHLEVCLIEAVETGKKNEKQKHIQISRKNRQNSQLLREINDLRVKVRDLEAKLKEREVQLQQVGRESREFTNSLKGGNKKQDRPSTNFETQSRQVGKNKTRQSFFEKSLFKNNWRQKRLKTEQGSRIKKSSHSFAKQDTNPNHLYIESKSEEVEELRRLLEQKETIIKQLINKIHKLS